MTALLIPNREKGNPQDLLLPDKALWRPNPVSLQPQRDRRGNIVIHKPLDLFKEIEAIKREAAAMRECARLGVPYLGGGAAGAWTFTDATRTDLLNGTYDLDTDTFKMALFLSTSNLGAATTTYAGVTNEHANANGYTTGGVAFTWSLSGTTTVTADGSDGTWTASGGSIVARFAAIYEVAGRVVCYCLLDSTPADVTVTTGNQLTVAIHASGVFTLA